mmetsp:Transcript_1731/g.2607  ORF Transcript_1731/g.2607 Transcript_1731/m.2607 type:complete len:91 (+) Transcript_1731:349-621(+)
MLEWAESIPKMPSNGVGTIMNSAGTTSWRLVTPLWGIPFVSLLTRGVDDELRPRAKGNHAAEPHVKTNHGHYNFQQVSRLDHSCVINWYV